MRNLQARIARRDAIDLARDPTETLFHLIFEAALCHELHADADAEERPATLTHRLLQGVDHSRHGIEAAPAIGKGADAGQHDTIGTRYDGGILRHRDRLIETRLMRRTLERLCGRMQIAGTVIDNGDSSPLCSGLGKQADHAGGVGCVLRRCFRQGQIRSH